MLNSGNNFTLLLVTFLLLRYYFQNRREKGQQSWKHLNWQMMNLVKKSFDNHEFGKKVIWWTVFSDNHKFGQRSIRQIVIGLIFIAQRIKSDVGLNSIVVMVTSNNYPLQHTVFAGPRHDPPWNNFLRLLSARKIHSALYFNTCCTLSNYSPYNKKVEELRMQFDTFKITYILR